MRLQKSDKQKVQKYQFSIFMIAVCTLLIGAKEIERNISEIRKLFTQINAEIDQQGAQKSSYYLSLEGWKKWNGNTGKIPSDIDKNSLFEDCNVYVQEGRVLKITYRTEPPSEDWTNRKDYYFYPNGNTAFVFEQHLTFHGYDYEKDQILPGRPFLIEIRHYIDTQGNEIKQLRSAFTVKDKKQVNEHFLHYQDLGIVPNVMSLPCSSFVQTIEKHGQHN